MSYSHLWNDMPLAEREKLYPHILSTHILHLKQTREKIVRHHKRLLDEIDEQIENIQRSIPITEPPDTRKEKRDA